MSLPVYSAMLDADPRTVLRLVELGSITPQARLTTGECLFDGSKLGRNRTITCPLIRTRRA